MKLKKRKFFFAEIQKILIKKIRQWVAFFIEIIAILIEIEIK